MRRIAELLKAGVRRVFATGLLTGCGRAAFTQRMKRFVFAVLAFAALAFAAAPVTSASVGSEEPGSGTLTWSVPTDGE